jgi:hypothetical protein
MEALYQLSYAPVLWHRRLGLRRSAANEVQG